MPGRADRRRPSGTSSWPPASDEDWIAYLAAPDDETGTPRTPPGRPGTGLTGSGWPDPAATHGDPAGGRAGPAASDDDWIAWLAAPDDDAPQSPAVGTPRTPPGGSGWPDPAVTHGDGRGAPASGDGARGRAGPASEEDWIGWLAAPDDGAPLSPAVGTPMPGRRTSSSNWLPWLTEGPVDRAGEGAVGTAPRRVLTPADLQTSFGPVPTTTTTAGDPFPHGYDDPFGPAVAITAEIPVTSEVPIFDDALPFRSRWNRVGWVLRDLVLLVAVGLAVVGAWVVLVSLRAPEPGGATDQLARQLDRAVAESLRADRVAAFGSWFVNVSTTLVLGGVVFRSFVGTAQTRALGWSPVRILRAAAVVGVVASLAVLPFRAAAIAGTGRVAMTDPATLEFVATSKVGTAALLRVAGLLLATFAVAGPVAASAVDGAPRRSRRRPADGSVLDHILGAAGALLLLGSYAWVGHPQSAGGPATLLVLGQMVHVLAVSTWFGGVALLYLQIRAGRRAGAVRTAAEVVERFSLLAGMSLVLAAATGVALARQQIASLDALTSTPYGQALALKLGLVALVALIGGYNKVSVVPRIAEMRGPAAWRTLHRTLLAEATVIAAGVLVATTAMTSGGL